MNEGYSFLQLLFVKYSDSEYLSEAWTPINETLKQFLQNSAENFKPTSYQTTYCQIYKTVCKGYKERLFDDLKNLVTEHCYSLKRQLDESMQKMIDDRSNTRMNLFFLQFTNLLHQYRRAIEAIVPLFHYLDIIYVKPKVRSSIEQELLLLYKTIIVESFLNHIFILLQHLINTSHRPSKETIDLLLHLISDITPESAIKQYDLFKRYCDGEVVFSEITSNDEDMITSAPRTASKRPVDDLPGEEDQPSAKRTTNMIKSLHTDN
ncbi:unnamed protein product [Rotaria magnacalcarata]|uniref:Cullin N-terminal domain-containing protein n=1 Tax=Rotaria magnacalcarata TaxID=392030 RepID=A0A816VAT9_9BILA|nr:unnamed protein product [Rotaria magnacalcarata]CAF2186868.1 unnamed protein product [Rotaria magnacalcarata]CAF3948577.1 unnamed protein product [Rotaria magnacalcarata]CAF4031297.1 unnamed protein product [Rotaria magnacalcarata]